jgi:hypothetical protein
MMRWSSVLRATKPRVKSKGSIRQLNPIMLGITHRIYESRVREVSVNLGYLGN